MATLRDNEANGMSERMKDSAYSEKLKLLVEKNKQIIKDLEDGKLTTQEASDRVTKLSIEIKELTSGPEGHRTKSG